MDCTNQTFLGVPAWYNNVIEAQGSTCGVDFSAGTDTFIVIGSNIIAALVAILAYILITYLIYAGITFITAQGDPQGIAAARTRIQNAIIGFVIAVFAYAIVRVVSGLFGVTTTALIGGLL